MLPLLCFRHWTRHVIYIVFSPYNAPSWYIWPHFTDFTDWGSGVKWPAKGQTARTGEPSLTPGSLWLWNCSLPPVCVLLCSLTEGIWSKFKSEPGWKAGLKQIYEWALESELFQYSTGLAGETQGGKMCSNPWAWIEHEKHSIPIQSGHPGQIESPSKALLREGGHHPIYLYCTKAPPWPFLQLEFTVPSISFPILSIVLIHIGTEASYSLPVPHKA